MYNKIKQYDYNTIHTRKYDIKYDNIINIY